MAQSRPSRKTSLSSTARTSWGFLWLGLALVVMAVMLFGPDRNARAQTNQVYEPGEVIVGFHEYVSTEEQAMVEQRLGDRVKRRLTRIHGRVIQLRGGKSVARAVEQYRRDPLVAYAEPNYILHIDTIPNDTRFGELYGLRNTGQTIQGVSGTAGADIDAELAWSSTTGTNTVVVGVVDTGVDYTHPDLAANIWTNPGGIGGCPAGTHGYNAITNACDPQDDHYHGTHVAGTIGAVGNNDLGVTGVNWQTSIMGLKFLNSAGSGTIADAIEAIDFAVQARIAGVNIQVLSNSWGGGGYSQALYDQIKKANDQGILFVAAAGNNGKNTDSSPAYPASYNLSNIISVAATDNRDQLAYFSNYGPASVDLGAPGVNTLSTTPNNSYGYLSGTSMATPHVSGAAALILAASPSLTTAQLKTTILGAVDPLPALNGKTVSNGRLNVCRTIPGCVVPTPPATYTLGISPSSQTMTRRGGPLSYTISINRSSPNSNPVDLSVTGLPASTTDTTFSSDPATGGVVSLSFTIPSSLRWGTYGFTVQGVDTVTGLTRTTTAQFKKRR